jgi:hypothetical protein
MDALFNMMQPPVVFTDRTLACKCGGEIIAQDGMSLCKSCFNESQLIDYNHVDIPMEMATYSYRRINHFREILSQFQAKQLSILPQLVYELIENHDGVLSYAVIRGILKKNKMKRYYEHIYFISAKYGLEVPFLERMDEERLCELFIKIQEPFSRHCHLARTNFLAYNFVLRKLLNVIGITKYNHLLKDLKNNLKQRIQDNIWELISFDLGFNSN